MPHGVPEYLRRSFLKPAVYTWPVKLEMTRLPTDQLEVFSSVLEGVSDWFTSRGMPMWPREGLAPDRLRVAYPDGEFWLGLMDGEPAATCVLIEHDPAFWPEVPPDESLFLHKLAVNRTFKGQGLSAHVLDFVRGRCLERDRRFLRLDTAIFNSAARTIYERYGFRFVGQRRVREFDSVLYELEVS